MSSKPIYLLIKTILLLRTILPMDDVVQVVVLCGGGGGKGAKEKEPKYLNIQYVNI